MLLKINKIAGFTLVELLLAVTLSGILMTGIVIFVSSSLGSNMTAKNTVERGNKNEDFEQSFTRTISNIMGSGVYATGASFGGDYLTGIFLKTGGSSLPITFLGLRTQTGYCDSYSGMGSETGTIMRLSVRQFTVPKLTNSTTYTISSSGNSVYSGATRIIGTSYPGNTLTASGIDTELSSPSALALSGTHLYVADTMNDRVLSYDITSGGIVKILGPENGIRKPTSLYFSGDTLLIASSGNGKIFSLEDGDGNGSVFSHKFKVAKDFSGDTIEFAFSGISSITSPIAAWSFSLTGVIQDPSNDLVITGATLTYTLTGGIQSFSTGTTYEFTVKNIAPVPTDPGNHTVTINFLSGTTNLEYSDTFHYFNKWDGLETNTGNVLTTLSGGLVYPHNITGANTWSGSIDWNGVLSNNPPGEETLSSLPIKDLNFAITGNVLTIQYYQYTTYDCMLGKHEVEEKVVKVLLP